MHAWITVAALMTVGPGWAAEMVIVDGDTLKLDGTTFRLDGIDAPEKDQTSLDEKDAAWTCGIHASNRLTDLAAKRSVQCQDRGPDPVYPTRRVGICLVDGVSLNRTLVREGWALNFEPYAKGRFEQDEAEARDNRRGLWKGCFAAPWDFAKSLCVPCLRATAASITWKVAAVTAA